MRPSAMLSVALLLLPVAAAALPLPEARNSTPLRPAAIEAWLQAMDEHAAADDAGALVRGLAALRLPSFDEVEKAAFRIAGEYADTVRLVKGARETIAFLDRLEAKIPAPRTEADRSLADELLVAIGRQRADALLALGETGEVDRSLAAVARRLGPSADDARSQVEVLRRQYGLVGRTAPDLVTGKDGETDRILSRLRGRVVVVDFFAHFCAPCISALPRLKEMYRDGRDRGLEIVTVNRPWGFVRDRIKVPEVEERSLTEALLDEARLEWPVVYGPKENFDVYGVRSLPVAVVLDRAGRVRFIHHGYTKHGMGILRQEVDTLLAEQAPPAGRKTD